MSFFRKPQEKKGSAVQAEAQAGKKAFSARGKGFNMPFFGKSKSTTSKSTKIRSESKPEIVEKKKTDKSKESDSKVSIKEKFGSASEVIVRPRITEKGSDVGSRSNAYTFDVDTRATKQQIKSGIKELYGVDPLKVHVVRIPSKKVRSRRGQSGVKSGGKKAYVYLKKNDTIEFV